MKNLISFAAILLTLHAISQNTFIKEFSHEGNNVAVQTVIQTSDGGYALTATVAKGESPVKDLWLIRTDGNGDTLWTRTFKNAFYTYSGDRILVSAPDDGYTLLTTRSLNAGLLHVSSTGDSLWEKTILPGMGNSLSRASGDGYIASIQNSWNNYVVLLDSAGIMIWQRQINSGYPANIYTSVGWSVREIPEGGFILAGANRNMYEISNPFLVRLGPDGDSLWHGNYANSWLWDGSFYSVDTITGGGYCTAGILKTPGQNGLVMKISAAGDTVWSRVIQCPKSQVFFSVRSDPNGGMVTCGSFEDTIHHIWLMKFDAAGNIVWDRKYSGPYSSNGFCVDRADDGGYILCGTTCQSQSMDCKGVLIKTASDGTLSGLNSHMTPFNVAFIPNPADESFSLIFSSGIIDSGSTFFLYDMLGHCVKTLSLQPGQTKYVLFVRDIPEGIYMANIISGNHTVAWQKLVIQRNP